MHMYVILFVCNCVFAFHICDGAKVSAVKMFASHCAFELFFIFAMWVPFVKDVHFVMAFVCNSNIATHQQKHEIA